MSQHHTSQNSSFGPTWPPEPAAFNRIRGFYTASVIETPSDVEQFAGVFDDQQRSVREQYPNVNRLSIRLVAHVQALSLLEQAGVHIEGDLPLHHSQPGLCIAYAAANSPDRRATTEQLSAYDHQLVRLMISPQVSTLRTNVEAMLRNGELEVHRVDPDQADELAPHFEPLYSEFGYDHDAVVELLGDEQNHIMYVARGRQVISTTMAQSGRVSVEGLGDLHMIEMTEARTADAYQGFGLYKLISGLLVREVVSSQGEELNSLYGELRLDQPGVLRAAYDNGREFSTFNEHRPEPIMPGYGILEQNVRIGDTEAYNDFALSYVTL